ncbi:hypothetical protein ANDA3_2029 [plant metagenome]|uniref:Uncharacterized protein n=1 Tax=plant metagenome TaxID=1297885 RepID=A0A484UE61_9ZZZZ
MVCRLTGPGHAWPLAGWRADGAAWRLLSPLCCVPDVSPSRDGTAHIQAQQVSVPLWWGLCNPGDRGRYKVGAKTDVYLTEPLLES